MKNNTTKKIPTKMSPKAQTPGLSKQANIFVTTSLPSSCIFFIALHKQAIESFELPT